MSERLEKFILNEAESTDDAVASVSIFNEIQNKIFLLQPFDEVLNKSPTNR